jgi:hypothetical protein
MSEVESACGRALDVFDHTAATSRDRPATVVRKIVPANPFATSVRRSSAAWVDGGAAQARWAPARGRWRELFALDRFLHRGRSAATRSARPVSRLGSGAQDVFRLARDDGGAERRLDDVTGSIP